jgi:hypothetical protein
MAVINYIKGGEDHEKTIAFELKGECGILKVRNWSIYGAHWFFFHDPIKHCSAPTRKSTTRYYYLNSCLPLLQCLENQ